MKRLVLVTIICSAFYYLSSGAAFCAQENSSWGDYVQRTFQSIIDLNAESARKTDYLYTGDNFPSRVLVTYTGQKRTLPEKRAEFLVKYFTKVRHDPQLAALFKSEILVRDSGSELWVPIQESLVPLLSNEVQPGGRVTVFAIWLGAFRQGEKIEWVFTINEFDAAGAK